MEFCSINISLTLIESECPPFNRTLQRLFLLITFCISLIFAGALGNILDSIFYGIFFDHSLGQIAAFLPENGGYAPVFYGKVVDMLYFPLFQGVLPEWIPYMGGKYFTFFEPVFNIADSAICIAVMTLIVFNKKVFPKEI